MFDEIILRLNLGCKLASGHLSASSFDYNEPESIVSISQSLDKLVVYRLNTQDLINDDQIDWSTPAKQVSYIKVKDVIKCVAISKLLLTSSITVPASASSRSLILIGCANCISIYDPASQCNITSITTKSPVELLITSERPESQIAIATDSQRIYVLRFEASLRDFAKVDVEVSCERNTGESLTCIAWGKLLGGDLIITGAKERSIRLYQVDSFDQNIQPCMLAINESASVSCLCSIRIEPEGTGSQVMAADLPAVDTRETHERLGMFAYGLDNGYLGAYRLFKESSDAKLDFERLWCQRARQNPQTMLMFDINGDGQEELIVGYASGRIEARSPFTGQLVASLAKCFKSTSERLVSLLTTDYFQDGHKMLLVCSTGSSLVGFRPRQCAPLRVPLRALLPDRVVLGKPQEILVDLSPELVSDKTEVHMHDKSQQKFESTNLSNYYSCQIRQNEAALESISQVLKEQFELKLNIRRSYQTNQQRSSKLMLSDLVIGASCTFDPAKFALRLTIVVGTNLETVRLIELLDESQNFLARGHLFVVPSPARDADDNHANDYKGKSHVVMLPLWADRDLRTSLLIKVFCGLDKLLFRRLDVPMFSMFTPWPEEINASSGQPDDHRNRLSYALSSRSDVFQTIEWLRDNFLCFHFGQLLDGARSHTNNIAASRAAESIWDTYDQSTGDFQLSLLDIRTRRKLVVGHKAGRLYIESGDSGLLVRLVQSLVIDKLKLELSEDEECSRQQHYLEPLLEELGKLVEDAEQLEESERKIQSELYEACEHTQSLLQQLAIAYELNEFWTAKELLNELFVMLNVAQSASKTHCLNNRSRKQFTEQAEILKTRLCLLRGEPRKGRAV